MEPQEFEKWGRVRQKGVIRYILKYGTFLALGYAYMAWSSLNTHKITSFDMIGIAITSIFGGVAISVIFWYGKEIPYQHTKQRRNPS